MPGPSHSLRLRLGLVAASALTAVLGVSGVAAVHLQRAELVRATGVLAHQQARALAQAIAGHTDAEIAQTGPAVRGFNGHESTVVEVVDARGRVLTASPGVDRSRPLLGSGVGSPVVRSGVESGESDRFVAVSLRADRSGRYVVAATSLESVDTAVASTTRLLLTGALILVLFVAGLGYWLAGRALRPVEAMRVRALEISSSDLGARLPVGPASDEIARLGLTLNDLLARLEAAQVTQRRFVTDASHELRSPIATMRTLLEVAQRDPRVDWGSVAELALAENQRLEKLTNDLLTIARTDHGPGAASTRERLDLAELVHEEAQRPRRVPVIVEADRAVLVMGEADALRRALRNLLDNAERHARQRILVHAAPVRGWAVLHVRDDGRGIAVEDRVRVFERFVRLDESRSRDAGGTGLGLAIVREIVARHGGEVAVVGSGPGADFEMRLPLD